MKKKGKCEELGFKEHYGDVQEVLSQIEKYEDYRVIWEGIKARLFHNLLPDAGAAILWSCGKPWTHLLGDLDGATVGVHLQYTN